MGTKNKPTVASFSYDAGTAMSDPKSMVQHGYDLVSRAYRADDAVEGQYAEWLDLLELAIKPGAAILDLGCGCGIPVVRRLASRFAVTGVDFSPVQVARARSLVPTATFICADMTTLQLGDDSFDAIVCLFALIHVPLDEQPDLLRDIRRWLRPGGLLLATVGHTAWTGVEKDWLGVEGADMWWSHADAETYRLWFGDAALQLQLEKFIPEGNGGHTLVLASRRVS